MKRFQSAIWRAALTIVISATCVPAQAQSIGDEMVTFLSTKLGARLGGGESSHLATEALRVGGGEFFPGDLGADYPGTGDKVWGSLVTTISYANGSWSDSNPSAACLPGDVLQFGGSVELGSKQYATRHTAVTKEVDSNNRPSKVFQQNFNLVRTVQEDSIDVRQLTAGWIRIYRPREITAPTNTWKFTVVNNSPSSHTYELMVNTSTVRTITATAANTAGSFAVYSLSTTGHVPCVVGNDDSIYVELAKGNEFFDATGSTGVRQLSK